MINSVATNTLLISNRFGDVWGGQLWVLLRFLCNRVKVEANFTEMSQEKLLHRIWVGPKNSLKALESHLAKENTDLLKNHQKL